MISGKHWGWALPGLLAAATCMAQAPKAGNPAMQKQLQHVREQVQSQEKHVNELKQQVSEAKQRNAADQAGLQQRDKEIARLKAQLSSKQAKSAAPAKPAKHPKDGHGH